MDVGRNSKGNWRVVGRKAVKVVKLTKKLKKPAGKLMKKAFGSICRMFSASTAPAAARPAAVQHNKDDEEAFMFCILQAKTTKPGWERSVIAVLKNCKGVRFQMDGEGKVEVSGIGNPSKLLKKIAKSSKVKQQWFQFSQCSANLFPPQPQPTKKEEKQPSLQQHNINNNINPHRLPTGGGGGGGGYGLGYQYPPQPYPPQPHPRIFW